MKTNKINELNHLIFCKRCNSIPLIELVPKEPEIKIILSCNCFRQQMIKQEIFFKYYYNNNYMEIEEIQEIKNESIKKLIKNYSEYKNDFMKNLDKIKDEINKKLRELIDNIELMFASKKKFNENIDKIIKIIIKNYQLNPNDSTNLENIIKNIQINSYKNFLNFDTIKFDKNISSLNKIVESFLKENDIIASDKFQLIRSFKKDDFIIELNKDIFASLKINDSIKIFKLKNTNEFYEIKKNIRINKILTDEKKKYLISVEDDYLIKFRDLNEIINKLSDNNYLKKSISFPTLYEFKLSILIIHLIDLNNNLLGISDKHTITIYEYDIENKNSNLLQKLDIKNDKLKLIKRNETNYICSYFNDFLNIYEIPSLIIKNKIKIQKQYNSRIIFEQISENELIIGENNNIKIINMDNTQSHLTKKINFDIMSIKVLKDRTILIGGRGEIKRLFSKTLEELPCLISFIDYSDYYEDYYDYAGLNLNNYNENDVLFIDEISDGKLMLNLPYDTKIYGINYGDIYK